MAISLLSGSLFSNHHCKICEKKSNGAMIHFPEGYQYNPRKYMHFDCAFHDMIREIHFKRSLPRSGYTESEFEKLIELAVMYYSLDVIDRYRSLVLQDLLGNVVIKAVSQKKLHVVQALNRRISNDFRGQAVIKAIREKDLEILKALDGEISNRDLEKAVQEAAQRGFLQIIQYYSSKGLSNKIRVSAAKKAAQEGHINTIRVLKRGQGFSTNACISIAKIAAKRGCLQMVQELLHDRWIPFNKLQSLKKVSDFRVYIALFGAAQRVKNDVYIYFYKNLYL